jgi:hypothetical protein
MTNLTLINNDWKQRVNPNITEEEKALIKNREAPIEERKAVMDAIRERMFATPSSEDVASAQAIYDDNKIEGCQLISVDVTLPSGSGIINYRVNGEHKQIRF